MTVCLLDPGLQDHGGAPSENLGDLIIQEAVLRELRAIFADQSLVQISTHTELENQHFEQMRKSAPIIVGGTNLLSSNMNEYNQWKITLRDAFRIKKAILLGVSWWQYQSRPNLYTLTLLRSALSSQAIHSVRDAYTKRRLKLMGFWNVVNTSCPTLWQLADLQPGVIPYTKAENALVMFTDYSQRPDLDRSLLELVLAHYPQVYVWPQGKGDRDYVRSFNLPVTLLDRSLPALDAFLNSVSCDYIGTRLHGGIRCLQAKKRSLILAIDHRAQEIGQETGLPTADRSDLAFVRQWIQQPFATRITLDLMAINRWKNQFKARRNVQPAIAQ